MPVEPGRKERAARVETSSGVREVDLATGPGVCAGWFRLARCGKKNPALRRGGDSHLVARAGVEPATFHFSGERYYQLSYLAGGWPVAHPATPTGLEPATSAVTGRRANQLRHGANFLTCWLSPARVTLAALPGFGKSGFGAA